MQPAADEAAVQWIGALRMS